MEINGNLDNSETGIPNYNDFLRTAIEIKGQFLTCFGPEIMNKIPLLIDNGTAHTGHTPVITPVWNKGLIIKLHISDGADRAKIIYQLGHELTHYVFYSLLGLNKPRADYEEETYCSAASLILLKKLFPQSLGIYQGYMSTLSNTEYKNGLQIAEKVNYDMNILKTLIIKKSKEVKNTM